MSATTTARTEASRFRTRRVIAAAAITAAAAGMLLPSTASAALPTPKSSVTLPATVDAMPKYDPASICSPTAKPGTLKLQSVLLKTYPTSRTLGMTRACGTGGKSEHKEGRAFDWGNRVGVSKEKANVDSFTAWALATDSKGNQYAGARRMGIMYMIWNDRIWSASSASQGWRPYLHPACSQLAGCGDTLRHRDHLHISMSWDGAMGRTSFWSGKAVTLGGTTPPTTTPVPPASTGVKTLAAHRGTVLKLGSSNSAVTALQKSLRMTTVTGYFGTMTNTAVVAYQKKHKLPTTGTVASMTWGALQAELNAESAKILNVDHVSVKLGSTGTAAGVLEAALNRTTDGKVTAADVEAVKVFQRLHGIEAIGIVGPKTWAALRGV